MENIDKHSCGGCAGGTCGCGGSMGGYGFHGGKHHLVKVILKLVIMIIIFWSGFQLGQITGSIRGAYGRGMINYGSGFGMMRGGGIAPGQTPAQ